MNSGLGAIPCTGYLSGPVDARRVHDAWTSGGATDLFGTSYLKHWFEELKMQGRSGIVVTSHPGERYEEHRYGVVILNRPRTDRSGWNFHRDMMSWTRDRLIEMEQLGASTVILTDAAQYWFLTVPFRKRGMRFVNSFHCALRSLGHRRFGIHETLIRLTGWYHLRYGDPTMAISPAIIEELAKEPGRQIRTCLQIYPDYDRATFETFEPPALASGSQSEVHVLFAGRVERNKGVFDMVTMAEILSRRGGPDIHFHIHGTGTFLDELRRAAAMSPASHLVHVHGFTAGKALLDHYRASDIVIVPTRSTFEEGLAKSVVEGVLTLRPVVSSRACPSITILGEACVEAKVDDPASYADAIWRLTNEPALVREKMEGARRLRTMFFDPPERYDRQLRRALAIAEG